MAGANYPKEENDWQKIHYSGDDVDKEAKISRIIYEWTMIDELLVNKVHTKQMIQYLIDEGHGSLLYYTGRSRRQLSVHKGEESTEKLPNSLQRYIKHLNEQSNSPSTVPDLIVRAILRSQILDKPTKEFMLATFQMERVRRIRSKSASHNNNLEIAESIIRSTKNRFRHYFYNDNEYNFDYFLDKVEDKQYFLPIRCFPTFMLLQEALCSYRRSNFNATLTYVDNGLEELKKTKKQGKFFLYHLIEWWFYYVQSRVYEGTYERKKYDKTWDELERCKSKLPKNVVGYLEEASEINESESGQEKYRLMKEYHVGLHLFIYNGPSRKEKSSSRISQLDGSEVVPKSITSQRIPFFNSVDEKLIRSVNGFREEDEKKGGKKSLPPNFKFQGLWSRTTSLPVKKYIDKTTGLIPNAILCAEILLNSANERRDHLLPSILKLVLIDTFTKLRFLFNSLDIAKSKKEVVDYNLYKDQIYDLVYLSRGIIDNIDYDGKEAMPITDWVSQIEEVLSKVKISSIEDLGYLIGSFIGFEYISPTIKTKKEDYSEKTDRLYRERRYRHLVTKISQKLQSDIDSSEEKLDVSRLSKEVKLDYNFVLFLLSYDQKLRTKLNEYENESLLRKEVDAWPSNKYRQQYLLQMCVPCLDKDSRLIRFSARPEYLFMTEGDNEFKTYRGIVGERNIRS